MYGIIKGKRTSWTFKYCKHFIATQLSITAFRFSLSFLKLMIYMLNTVLCNMFCLLTNILLWVQSTTKLAQIFSWNRIMINTSILINVTKLQRIVIEKCISTGIITSIKKNKANLPPSWLPASYLPRCLQCMDEELITQWHIYQVCTAFHQLGFNEAGSLHFCSSLRPFLW